VLVVEDNADARGSLRMLLEAMGHDVYDSADGAAAIADAARLEPDVALIDIGLPGLDGYEVARRIRAAGGTARLVALSGYARDEDKRRAFQAGFDEHLTKPALPDELDRVLKGARVPPDLALPHSEVGVF